MNDFSKSCTQGKDVAKEIEENMKSYDDCKYELNYTLYYFKKTTVMNIDLKKIVDENLLKL